VRRRYVRDLHLVRRNVHWLRAGISLSDKLRYYGLLIASYARLALFGRKSIRYLGSSFEYDNPATPLNLQMYPFQLKQVIAHMERPPGTVLDVGANIGQLAVTLAALLPSASIDALEPNGAIYALLERNARPHERLHPFNVGVGEPGDRPLYFEPTRSAIGSLVKHNAGNQDRLREVAVTLVDDVPTRTGRDNYDLIVIDVEGAELEVVRCLAGVRCLYMLIEVSGLDRQKQYAHSELFALVAANFGRFEIQWLSDSDPSSQEFEMLLRFCD
jgi:FkbM family methyltransferase